MTDLPARDISSEHRQQIADLNAQSWEAVQSNPRAAFRLAKEALTSAEAIGDSDGCALARLNAGWALIHLGRYDEAVGLLNGAREAYASLQNHDGTMKAINALGVLSYRIGEPHQAQEFFEEGLRRSDETQNVDRRIAFLNNLGELFANLGEPSRALEHYRTALELARQQESEAVQAVIQANLGRIYLELGNADAASAELHAALERAMVLDDRITEAETLTQIGRLVSMQNDGADPEDEAEALHLQSIELCEEIGHPSGVIAGLEHLGALLIRQDRLEEAEEHLRNAVDQARDTESPVTAIETLDQLSRRYEENGDALRALAISRWLLSLQQEHAGADTARKVRTLRARHELDQARMEAEIMRLRNVELREKSEALEVSNRKLQLMHRIGSELTSTLEIDEIGRRLHDRVNELMRADVFGVAFYREDEDVLDFAIVIEDDQRITPFVIPAASQESFGSWVIRNRREISMTDADRQHKKYVVRRKSIAAKRCRSIVFLPLELEGRIIGVLTVQSHEKNVYDQEKMDLLHLLSPYIAVAMDNSRKLETIRELNSALEDEKEHLQGAYRRIAHMANHDILTQLPNRRLLTELIHEYIPLARRQSKEFGVLYVDLDNFKPVNDTFGHDSGDQVLVRIADRLVGVVRESDTVARIGGDEFVLIVRDVGGISDVIAVAEKVHAAIQEPVDVEGDVCRLAASIGVSLFPDHGASYDELINAADHAMYRAKETGKSGISIAASAPSSQRRD